jgi:carboxyl-terminal processing protease
MVAALLVLTFGAGAGVDRYVWDEGSNANASSSVTDIPEFETFQATWDLIHDHFVDTSAIDDPALIYAATQGMVEALGDTQHSTFLDPATAEMYQRYMRGELIGIGVELDYSSGRPVITSTLEGSPAEDAGIKAKDMILEINGQSTEGESETEIGKKLRGDEGTKVEITLQREGDTTP